MSRIAANFTSNVRISAILRFLRSRALEVLEFVSMANTGSETTTGNKRKYEVIFVVLHNHVFLLDTSQSRFLFYSLNYKFEMKDSLHTYVQLLGKQMLQYLHTLEKQ
jgi:hypothetical protein